MGEGISINVPSMGGDSLHITNTETSIAPSEVGFAFVIPGEVRRYGC